MGLPPTHRVDHTPRIILSFDDAWDMDRINAESNNGRDLEHPWMRYHGHRARGDLATVKHLLRKDPPLGPALVFELRRLTLRELSLVENRELTSAPTARNFALSLALADVEGADVKLDRGDRAPHALTDEGLETLRGLVGDAGLRELGNHAIACSRMELTDPEKKPSGS